MKAMKRILAVTLALAAILSLSVFAGATESGPEIIEGEDFIIIKQDGPSIMPREATLIDTIHYTGKSHYTKSVRCRENEGNALNVYVDNREGNGTLNVFLTVDGGTVSGEDQQKMQLPAGKAQTYIIMHKDKSDLGGTVVDIEIGSNDGHEMNFSLRARQYLYGG